MPALVIYPDRALTPTEEIPHPVVVVTDARIAAIGRRDDVPVPPGANQHVARGMTLVPGFVDLHIHGASGHDVMEGTREALETVATTVARSGTTSLLATTVTASETQTCQSARGIAHYIRSQDSGQVPQRPIAEILGIHFEGPFISHTCRGVHPPDWIALPSISTLRHFLEAAEGTGRILTLAPELPLALELIDALRAAGLVPAMGHTNATYAETVAAIARGARHAVHFFNAMRPFSHRETGIVGAVLTAPDVFAELIADGVHVDPAAMKLLIAAKGIERLLLVSDGTAATGMPDGRYRLGTFEVLLSGGVCRNAEGKLAGSALTLDRALRVVVDLGVPLGDALRMLTLNPAKQLGIESRKGVLAAGADADLVLLDSELRVASVMTRGVSSFG